MTTENSSEPKTSPWVTVVRPKTLFASLGPVLLGLGLAYQTSPDLFNATLVPWIMLTALLLQAASNLINDYYDAKSGVDQKRKFGPTRAVAMGLLSGQKVKLAFMACLALAFIIGSALSVFRGGFPLFGLGLICILFAYLYTGGPKPLSHYGLGEVLAIIFFGPVVVSGTFYLQTTSIPLSLSFDVLCHGFASGFLAGAIMAINNLRDRETDLQAGKITLAILVGPTYAKKLPAIFVSVAMILPLYLLAKNLVLIKESFSFYLALKCMILSLVYFLPFLFKSIFKICLHEMAGPLHNLALARTGQLLFLYNFGLTLFYLL